MKRLFTFIFKIKNSWLPYVFEFTLLFLAIYLGFLTENYRDAEEKKEMAKSYIEEIINDIRLDQKGQLHVSSDLKRFSDIHLNIVQSLDSVISYGTLNDFYTISHGGGYEDYFSVKTAYTQLMNGGYALITDVSIRDSINSYYGKIEDIEFELDLFWKHVNELGDARMGWFNSFKAYSNTKKHNTKAHTEKLEAFIIPNSEKEINTYFEMSRTVHGFGSHLSHSLVNLYHKGDRLIHFLEEKLKNY